MKIQPDLTENTFYKSNKTPSPPMDKHLEKSSQTGISAPLKICRRKHYPSDSPAADTGLRCWQEGQEPALSKSDQLPNLRLIQCLSLADLNDKLEQLHLRTTARETTLWQLLAEVDRFREAGGEAYWLTIMRVAELALFTAGAYADSCESRAAGDLLANPVRVLIHLQGRSKPKVKPRHAALSAALRKEACPDMPFMVWFRRNVLLEVTQKALLPELVDRLSNSPPSAGSINIRRFLEGLRARMQTVADTIAFLSAWQVDTAGEFQAKILAASPDTRRFIEANLCRFKDSQFIRMGTKIRSMVNGRNP